MKFAFFVPTEPDELWSLAAQLGVSEAVTGIPYNKRAERMSWDYLSLLHMKQRFADAGLNVAVIESTPPMDRIKLGLPGRDEEIDQVAELLTNMGAVGIPVWCYNFMAVFGWLRTSMSTVSRGGALVTSYDHSLMEHAPLTEAGEVSEERLWDNLAYFLERIVPVAEAARVKLALHPDDPPVSPIRGVGRIMTSVEAFQRAMTLVPSSWNGLTFCQGNFTAMGANIPSAIYTLKEHIHFAHFRDVRGTATRFVETFHDNGPTDMLAAMRCYREIGFEGVMRPDHVPTLIGDANDTPGYTTRGRIYALGYMRGLSEAL